MPIRLLRLRELLMSRGFTLIEMVITIILIGIVGLFLGNISGQAMGI